MHARQRGGTLAAHRCVPGKGGRPRALLRPAGGAAVWGGAVRGAGAGWVRSSAQVAMRMNQASQEPAGARAAALYDQHREAILRRTDRLFAELMVFQWLAVIAAAWWISPRTWA